MEREIPIGGGSPIEVFQKPIEPDCGKLKVRLRRRFEI